jgi:hypothetical protein
MHDSVCRLQRINLPRTPVNKARERAKAATSPGPKEMVIAPFWLPVSAAYEQVGGRRIHAPHPPSFLSIGSQVGRGTEGTDGVVALGSSAPFSSCFLCVRDKCSGPAQMTTTIAATTISPQ